MSCFELLTSFLILIFEEDAEMTLFPKRVWLALHASFRGSFVLQSVSLV